MSGDLNIGFAQFPKPSERKNLDSLWIELMLGIEKNSNFQLIVENIWSKLSNLLLTKYDVSIKGPDKVPWFHLRRRTRPKNPENDCKKNATGRIEILRIKKGSVNDYQLEEIRVLSCGINEVICAGWWPLQFAKHHDIAFLSFLQKLSEIRIRYGSIHDRWINNNEAFSLMMNQSYQWSHELVPWLTFIKNTKMEQKRADEYAHWFAHILSGW